MLELSFGQVLVVQAKLSKGVSGREDSKCINMEIVGGQPTWGAVYTQELLYRLFFPLLFLPQSTPSEENSGVNEKACFVMFANPPAVNNPAMTDSMLPREC